MVTSTAIPSATLKTNTVLGFIATPAQPITPAVKSKGIMFGMRLQINILQFLNRYNMQTAMRPKAQRMLSFKPFTMYLLPSKKVSEAPANDTL